MSTSAVNASGSTSVVSSVAAKTAAVTGFSQALSAAAAPHSDKFYSGRLGIELDTRGQPGTVIYLDEAGKQLSGSAFTAEEILRNTQAYGISLTDLTQLGVQLDAAGIGYRPYELYKGTGSDHGVNFEDLIAGGLGSAYDWRKDDNAGLKGRYALADLEASRALADSLGLDLHPDVTTSRGIDPAYFAPQEAEGGNARTQVVFNGSVAVWVPSTSNATAVATQYHGTVIDVGTPKVVNVAVAANSRAVAANSSAVAANASGVGTVATVHTDTPTSLVTSVPSTTVAISSTRGISTQQQLLETLINSLGATDQSA